MILNLNPLRIHRPRIKTQTNQRINRRRLRDPPKRPTLLVLKLYQVAIILDNFVTLVYGRIEEFGESKPLTGHFIPVICVDELVVVDAVGCVPFYTVDGGFAGVEGYDVVYQSLSGC